MSELNRFTQRLEIKLRLRGALGLPSFCTAQQTLEDPGMRAQQYTGRGRCGCRATEM